MSVPDYQSLMLPVLELAAKGEWRVADIADPIADSFGLSLEEREEMLPSGKQRLLHNRIHWAKFYLSRAGLIHSPARGRFTSTPEGRQLLSSNPQRIDTASLMLIPQFREFYQREGTVQRSEEKLSPAVSTSLENTDTPEEQIEKAHRAIDGALREELLDRILQNSPSFFEQIIVDLLVSMGYGGSHVDAAKKLGRSGDGGIDGIINEDRLGLDRVYIQAKRYAIGNSVGRPDVQGFVGSLVGLGASKGVFVTTSSFSHQAKDFVRHLSQRVVLIDGQTLANLMIEHGVGVRTYRVVEFKRLDEDFFNDAG
ncbi:restriction endonuclease [Asticcacaulis sp.]|jgi:restriction system protein|uniref:restriction endonuclease n=1 Tax=Asticcacaulis sp. TaxID=1872648 RepID=UPI0031CF5482